MLTEGQCEVKFDPKVHRGGLKLESVLPTVMLSSWLASRLFRWNVEYMILAKESFRCQFVRWIDRMFILPVCPIGWFHILLDRRMARSSAYPYFLDSVSGRSWK